jgi:hypothetical protein
MAGNASTELRSPEGNTGQALTDVFASVASAARRLRSLRP